MTPEQWAQAEELFHRALECEPAEQHAILDGADPELRREVEALLSSRQAATNYLRDVVDRPAEATTAAGSPDLRPGVVIGPYHLLQLIGEGGMGEVWLAEQKQPVRRRVALKLIKTGMSTREVMARFESERQALALMDHPAIAKVFDAGSTADGQPYFVMEYVPGIAVTDYCDRHKLTTQQRLELFILVCEGVQHAHQKAIIHRDLKPSNILVAEVDGKPMPRIIDFGVAKVIGQRLTAETMYTQVGAVIGTMGYMSPEQAELSREDVDTRSDVYSLGVVLYELLVGALPFDFRKIAFDEALRRLREEDAPKPSTSLRTQGAESTATAKNRGTDVPTLVRQVRGDPDTIALKALEKERTRRYATPLELAGDIGRYLRHEPVLAHPPSVAYRARKYVRRHRLGVVFAAALVLLFTAAAVSQTIQLRRVTRERDRADTEAATAKAVNDFLQDDLLGQANPRVQAQFETRADPDLRVRTALDRAAKRVAIRFARKPLVEAAIHATIGNAYVQLGLFAEGRRHLERALDLRRRHLGPDNPATLDSMFDVAFDLYRFEHKYVEAEPIFTKLLEVRQRLWGADNPDTLDTMSRLGDVCRYEGNLTRAEALLTTAMNSFNRLGNPRDFRALYASNDLALVYQRQGRTADAEAMFLKALQGLRAQVGEEHPETLNITNNLADLYRDRGEYAQAESLLSKVIDARRRLLGDEHAETQRTMDDLANVYAREHKFAEAEPLFVRLVDLRTRSLGPENPETLMAMSRLARLYEDEGKYPKADYLNTQVDEIERRITSPMHPR